MYQTQYLCLYRPVWRDSEEDEPTDQWSVAVAQLRSLYVRRRGNPVRIVNLRTRQVVGKLGY